MAVLGGTGVLLAMIGIYKSELRTQRELEALRSSIEDIRSSASSASRPLLPFFPPSAVADLHALAQRKACPTTADPAPADERKVAPEETREQTQEETQEHYVAAYRAQNRDPAWSREAESRLESSLRGALPPGSRRLSIDCRTTMCMTEVAHTDETVAHADGWDSWIQRMNRDWGEGGLVMAGERQSGGEIVQRLILMSNAFSADPQR